MHHPVTAREYLKLARSSGLIDEGRFAALYPDESDLPADSRSCATALVEADLLTTYQADQLLAGRSLGLVIGSYRILRPIGSRGSVYLAEHGGLRGHRRPSLGDRGRGLPRPRTVTKIT